MAFIDEYKLLLIKQYYDQPNASAEIALQASTWQRIFEFLKSFPYAFDVDHATGDRLDKIGKIVGLARIVPFVIEKVRFGFDGDDTSLGFADAFDASVPSAVFYDAFEAVYTSQVLDDEDFRFFIKAKIASNIASAYMISDDRVSIQDAIQAAFDGQAFVKDNLDMSLFLYVSTAVDAARIRIVNNLDLLPKTQGVRWRIVQIDSDVDSFGFTDDESALGFGDAFDPSIGGTFAEFIFID